MTHLTNRQRETLCFVILTTEQGVQATTREIDRHFGCESSNATPTHLRALMRKGYLAPALEACQARSIRILRDEHGRPYRTPLERLEMLMAALIGDGAPQTFDDVLAQVRAAQRMAQGPRMATGDVVEIPVYTRIVPQQPLQVSE